MSKKLNIAINGFGRIGRALTKINEEFHKFNLVLINDLNPNIENLASNPSLNISIKPKPKH